METRQSDLISIKLKQMGGNQAADLLDLFSRAGSLICSHPAFASEWARHHRTRAVEFHARWREGSPLSQAAPETVLKVMKDVCKRKLEEATVFYRVEPDYYERSLAVRSARLNAPSVAHLCKSVVMENTQCTETDMSDKSNSRFYIVITQYVEKIDTAKLAAYLWSLKAGAVSKKRYNMRLADSSKSLELTGFDRNGVSPLGTNVDIPIVLSKAIAELQPPFMYLGAGDVDWKISVDVRVFIQSTNCHIVDLS